MQSARVAATIAACAAVRASGSVSLAYASPAAAAGSWRTAIEIPGLAALDQGGDAFMHQMSCSSPGKPVPGISALNTHHSAETVSVSCAAAGRCSAAGFYAPRGTGEISTLFVTTKS